MRESADDGFIHITLGMPAQ